MFMMNEKTKTKPKTCLVKVLEGVSNEVLQGAQEP